MGGAVGDTTRARPIIVGGLSVSLVAAILALLLYLGPGMGPGLFLVRLRGRGIAAFVMPVALAMAATSYAGVARATAIGIAYAGYGAGQGLSPTWCRWSPATTLPAFVGAIVACAIGALVIVRGRIPDLERANPRGTPLWCGNALWASAVVLVLVGLPVDRGQDGPTRCAWALMLGGVAWWSHSSSGSGGGGPSTPRRSGWSGGRSRSRCSSDW